jgi:hypothetical protein
MADSGALSFHLTPCVIQQPAIVVGVTSQETCRAWGVRLQTLRRAGFRVLLVSSPGILVDRTAALAGVERIFIPMRRCISPLADLLSLFRLWWLLGRRRPSLVEFSTPKAGLLGTLAARLRGVPRRVYMLRGLKLERTVVSSAEFCSPPSVWLAPLRTWCFVTVQASVPKRWRSASPLPKNYSSWVREAASA